jgi:NAD(P)-dependent dehydrogenase (short-subunit alcohol dehydrogenase family)
MDLQLHGKRALVTGSTAGIGLAIAQELAQEGAAVVIIGRSQAKLDQALEAVRQGSRDARAVLADVISAEGVGHLVHEVPDVDILVNNLGTYEPKEFTEICDEDWLRIFNINVMSGVRLSRHYLPGMLRRNWGRIVFVSSESAVNIPSEMIHYGVTKTAQVALARGLAETTRGTAVTINSVLPGPTYSEGIVEFLERMSSKAEATKEEAIDEFFQKHRPTSLLQRLIDPHEVAHLVTYLASPLSSATNGAALRVEGGLLRSIL